MNSCELKCELAQHWLMIVCRYKHCAQSKLSFTDLIQGPMGVLDQYMIVLVYTMEVKTAHTENTSMTDEPASQ